MNKIKFSILFLILCFTFSSCETMNAISDKISSIFSESSVQNTKKSNNQEKISKKLETPIDYEKAYSYRTNKADSKIIKLISDKKIDNLRTSSPDEYVKSICSKITEYSENDFHKVKMAHDVVCVLVSYDAKSFWENNIPDQSWKNVLQTKNAVCEGYANLFKYFCDTLKIPCTKISGYARGVGFDLAAENPSDSNHAWNTVKIENCWYIVDTTWDSGYMNGKKSQQAYNTSWLFTKPDQVIYTHLPTQPRYQLLESSFSNNDFHKLPYLTPDFFDSVTSSNINLKSISSIDSSFSLELNKKNNISFSYTVRNKTTNNIVNNAVFVQESDDKSKASFLFPKAGTYEITILYKESKNKLSFSCGSFILNATEGTSLKYPTTFENTGKNLEIISPQTMPLQRGQTSHFEIKVSNKNGVIIVLGKKTVDLQKTDENLYSGDITIPDNISQIQIGLKNPKGNYEIIAQYSVK